MTYEKLGPKDLAALGGAFAAGYDSEAAKRNLVPELSFSPKDDLSLALGWPFVLELEPPETPTDPVKEVLARLAHTVPPRSWPVDLVTRAVRVLQIFDLGTGMDKTAAHACVLEQYGMFRLPGAVALIADMAAKSAVKTDAIAWLVKHASFAQPVLAALAKSSSPAKANAEKALKELAKRKPS